MVNLFFHWFDQTPTIMMSMVFVFFLSVLKSVHCWHEWHRYHVTIDSLHLFFSHYWFFYFSSNISVGCIIVTNRDIGGSFTHLLEPIGLWCKVRMITRFQKLLSVFELFLFSQFSEKIILIDFFLILLDGALLWESWLFWAKDPFAWSLMLPPFIRAIRSWAEVNCTWRNVTVSIELNFINLKILFIQTFPLSFFCWWIVPGS